MGPSDRSFDDGLDNALIDTCRECHRELWVRGDEIRPDGPFVCDACRQEASLKAELARGC